MACGKSASPPPSQGSGSSSADAPAKPPSQPAPVDAVYLELERKGFVSIERGAFKTLVADKAAGSAVPRKGGGIFVWVDGTIHEYDGELKPLAGAPKGVEPRSVGPDGVLWAVTHGTVATYDGKAWSEQKTGLGERYLVTRFHFAADGTVYLPGSDAIAVRRGGAWSTVPAGDRVSSSSFAHGALFVTTEDRVLKLDGDKLVEIGKTKNPRLVDGPDAAYLLTMDGVFRIESDKVVAAGKLGYLTEVAFAPDGTLYGFGLDKKRLVRRRPDGAVDKVPATDLPFDLKHVSVDTRGRLWLVLEYGFALLDGEKLTVLTPGTVPEVRANVDRLLTTGAGADLPDVGPPKLINLKGVFVAGGKPKAGVKVELCPNASSVYYGASPCEGKGFVRRATSGADGAFEVKDVPLGGWHIIYKMTSDSWVYYFPPGCCGGLPKGGTFDMGEIEFGRSSQ